MEKKGIFAFSLLMLFMVSVVSAADTEIVVKTLPDHTVDIYALRVGEAYSLIESFHKVSDSNGSASIVLSTSEPEFNLKIDVRKDNTKIVSERFNETYTSGESVNVELYPEWYLEQLAIEQSGNFADDDLSIENDSSESNKNETPINDSSSLNKTEEKSQDSNAITGFFTSLREKIPKNTLYYSIAFVLLIGVFYAGFSFLRKRRDHREPAEPKGVKVTKLSELTAKKDLLDDAEKKIGELQEQIRKIRDSTK